MSGLMPSGIWVERKGRDGQDQSNLRIRNYGRKFALQTTGLIDAQGVMNFPGLPNRWDSYPTDQAARCVSVRPEQHDSNPFIWFLTAEYTTDYILQDFSDPAFKLPEVEWDVEERQVVCPGLLKTIQKSTEVNIGNQPPRTVVTTLMFTAAPANSATDPFDPPPLYDKCDPVLCVEATYTDFSISRAMIYNNSLNQDSFFDANPGQIRAKIKAKRFQWRDQFRWTVNYRFAYRAEGWQLQVLDIGPRYQASDNADLQSFVDKDGNTFLGLLDGHGRALSDDPKKPTTKPPVFLTMSPYPVTPFAPLGIEDLLNKVPTLNQQ